MVTIAVLAVAAAVIVPGVSNNDRLRLMAAANVMTSDIELAQVMTISFPNDPIVVRFDPDNATYWLARPADPETPILRDDNGQPYLVVLGEQRASSAAGVAFTLSDVAADTLTFSALGGMADLTSAPSVTLRIDTRWIRLDVATTTGTITEVAGND
jgi:hypothetical protein